MPSATDDDSLPTKCEDMLALAVHRAVADPVSMPVRNLIAYWGHAGRGHRVIEKIKRELANHGLASKPDFSRGHIDSYVSLILTPQEAQSSATEPSGLPEKDGEVGLLVRSLRAASQEVTSIKPQATLPQARTIMIMNDFSQLPVLSSERTLHGVVTWESIGKRQGGGLALTLRDVTVAAAEAQLEDDLLPILPIVAESGYVIVRDHTNKVCGIVTAADVTLEFGALASPYFLVGEIERRIRKLSKGHFAVEDLEHLTGFSAGDGGVDSLDELTLGQFQRLLESPGMWERLPWDIDRRVFLNTLDEVRQIRNGLMHFSPDLPTDVDRSTMVHFLDALRALDVD